MCLTRIFSPERPCCSLSRKLRLKLARSKTDSQEKQFSSTDQGLRLSLSWVAAAHGEITSAMLRRVGSSSLRTGLQWRRVAVPPLQRFAGQQAAFENRANDAGPILKRPDRPMDDRPRGPLRLVGAHGPVKNMDVKTSVDQLSPACELAHASHAPAIAYFSQKTYLWHKFPQVSVTQFLENVLPCTHTHTGPPALLLGLLFFNHFSAPFLVSLSCRHARHYFMLSNLGLFQHKFLLHKVRNHILEQMETHMNVSFWLLLKKITTHAHKEDC